MAMDYRQSVGLVLSELEAALTSVDGAQAEALADQILAADKVFLVGVGRVLLSLQAFCKRLNHLAVKAYFVGEINEPAITGSDLLIVGSGSGESLVPVAIAQKAKSLGAQIAHIGSNPDSSLAPITDLFVRIPVQTKFNYAGELQSRQIMSSLFEQSLLLFGDCVSLMIARRQNLDVKSLWQYHANLE